MLIIGDCLEKLKELPDQSVNCCVTSPPYWGLRDYGVQGQIGLEETLEEYISKMVAVFAEVKRVLRDDGTCWINLGDLYSGSKPPAQATWDPTAGVRNLGGMERPGKKVQPSLKRKDLVGLPWRIAFALQADGWYLRQDIIWAKPNPMPESVRDRCTRSHEYIFLLSKSARYYYDQEAIKEPAGGWRGSKFHDGKNAIVHPNVGKNRKVKVPSGWDTRKGGHGSYHRDGRGEPEYKEWDSSMANGAPNIRERKHADKDGEPYLLRNKRDVWDVATVGYAEAHFATYPPPAHRTLHPGRMPARGDCVGSLRRVGDHGGGRYQASAGMGIDRTESRLSAFDRKAAQCRADDDGGSVDMTDETRGNPYRPLKREDLNPLAGDMMRGRSLEQIAELKHMNIWCLRDQVRLYAKEIILEMVKIEQRDKDTEIRRDRSAEITHPYPYRDKNLVRT